MFLVMRIEDGVISTSSSGPMYSTASSSPMSCGSLSTVVWSLLERTLVAALALQGLSSRSPGRWWMPITMPEYVSTPGLQNMTPRSWHDCSAYEVTGPCAIDTSEPLSRVLISPTTGPYSQKLVLMMACPLVAVSIALRAPSRPRVGILYLTTVLPPVTAGSIEVMMPLRALRMDTAPEMTSSGASTMHSSYGSSLTPSSSLIITVGGPTMNSKPSRRMFSIKMVMCSAPRPDTIN
mmetsp:Transcript_1177/g.3398  ORF Transcript_1177/g.3398 Transcript_1177/m.3398 type:complete len:236 (-) Transcript_1177:225-932(-)